MTLLKLICLLSYPMLGTRYIGSNDCSRPTSRLLNIKYKIFLIQFLLDFSELDLVLIIWRNDDRNDLMQHSFHFSSPILSECRVSSFQFCPEAVVYETAMFKRI